MAKKPAIRKRGNQQTGAKPEAVLALDREGKAVAMRKDGATLKEIASALGYASKCGAHHAIVRGMARLSPIENIEELRAKDVATTYEIQKEAMEQWHRSTEDATKHIDADTRDGVMETNIREGQTGNPALLDKVLKAMERRAKLLGLDAPEKLDVRSKSEIDLFGQDPAVVFDAAARRARGELVDDSGK